MNLAASPTMTAHYFLPKLGDARRDAMRCGKSLSQVLEQAELLTPEQRRLVDQSIQGLAESVWAVDQLLEGLRGGT